MNTKGKKTFKRRYIVAGILITLFMPDLLMKLRSILSEIPVINGIICMKQQAYAKLEAGLILNTVALLISIMAFRVADSSGRIQEEEKRQKAVLYAQILWKEIQHNGTVLWQANNYIAESGELIVDEHDEEYIAFLFSIRKLNKEQMVLCRDYQKRVIEIKTAHRDTTEKEEHNEIIRFCNDYFDRFTSEIVFNYRMRKLISVLDEIRMGE